MGKRKPPIEITIQERIRSARARACSFRDMASRSSIERARAHFEAQAKKWDHIADELASPSGHVTSAD